MWQARARLRATPGYAAPPLSPHLPEHPMSTSTALDTWHRLVREHDPAGLDDLLADDVVFHSPVVHTPQRGKALTALYLGAAFQVFFNPNFRYVREVQNGQHAVLEFETEIDGIVVNGVDMITWNAEGRIVDFKVMLRPLKAVHLIHQKMGQMLDAMKPPAAR
jgi:ketosteroid isomerase-like protein